MIIIPAIDLKGGKVVRLSQGKKQNEKIYTDDAVGMARMWEDQGAKIIHVVDLDGAFQGKPQNLSVLKKILKAVKVKIEFGGGVRNIAAIEELLDIGVYRVALGTRAIEDPVFLKTAFKKFKNKIIVSVDARNGAVTTRGWLDSLKGPSVEDFVKGLMELGFKQIVYTDVLKDGMLQGPNFKSIKEILKKTKIKVIASGGISSLSDLAKLKIMEKDGVTGVIVGKALYEGRFNLTDALKLE